jgi:hypothetical protein
MIHLCRCCLIRPHNLACWTSPTVPFYRHKSSHCWSVHEMNQVCQPNELHSQSYHSSRPAARCMGWHSSDNIVFEWESILASTPFGERIWLSEACFKMIGHDVVWLFQKSVLFRWEINFRNSNQLWTLIPATCYVIGVESLLYTCWQQAATLHHWPTRELWGAVGHHRCSTCTVQDHFIQPTRNE